MNGGYLHKDDCSCQMCERIKLSHIAGKKQFFGVRLPAWAMDKIRQKCQAGNCTSAELIEGFLQDGQTQVLTIDKNVLKKIHEVYILRPP